MPSGLTCEAGIGIAVLFWDNPFLTYGNHAVSHIYRYTADEFNNATEIGTSTGISYVDDSPSDALDQTYFYWVRWETEAGMSGLGLPSEVCEVDVIADPAIAIARLSMEILADPLTEALLTPVGTAGDPVIEFVRRYQVISQRIAERIADVRARITESIALAVDRRQQDTRGLVDMHSIDIAALEARLVGVSLGPAPSEFSAITRAEAEALRDAQASSDAAWLAAYDADSALNIRLVYGVVRQFQHRVNNQWENNGDEEPTVAAIATLNARVITAEGRIVTNAEAITLLTGQIGGLASASAVDALQIMVTQIEGQVTASATAITQLMTDLQGKADASALNLLSSTVTQNGDNITALADLVTSLTASVAGKADASAVTSLTTRVSTNEGGIQANSDALTALTAEVAGKAAATAVDALMTMVTTQGGLITVNADAITALSSMVSGFATAAALQALTTMVTTQGGAITVNADAITQLMTDLQDRATAAALNALSVKVDDQDGRITVNADALTILEAMIPGLATAAALDLLSTRVTQEAGRITVNADAITSLSSMIAGFASVTALQALTLTVAGQADEISINAAEITALEAAHGGRTLGPTQNIFEGDSKAAARALRNAYAAANPAWLAQYDADNDINIELRWGVLYIYQRRLNNAWLDNGEALARAAAVTALNITVIAQQGMITSLSDMVTMLSAQVGAFDATAFQELSVRVTSTENVDGTTTLAGLARWLVKTQVGDLVGGVGLLNDGTKVRFYIAADRFAIYPPGVTDLDDAIVPFIVDGDTVYIDIARIRDGAISSLKASDAFLTNMTVAHGKLAFARIDQGNIFDLTIGDTIQSENYQPQQVGWRITKGGLFDIWGGAFRGTIQSGNFTPGDNGSGWRLQSDGTGELDAAYIRGILTADHIDSDVRNTTVLWTGNENIGSGGVTLTLEDDVTDFATVEVLFYLPAGGGPSSYAISGFPGVLVPDSGTGIEAGVAVGRGDGQTVRVRLTTNSSGLQLTVTRAFTSLFNARILALVGFRNPGGIVPPPQMTTDTDEIYRLAVTAPAAPSGGTSSETHTPTGWQRTEPNPTPDARGLQRDADTHL